VYQALGLRPGTSQPPPVRAGIPLSRSSFERYSGARRFPPALFVEWMKEANTMPRYVLLLHESGNAFANLGPEDIQE